METYGEKKYTPNKNWGKRSYEIIKSIASSKYAMLGPKEFSIIDIGCGCGQFCVDVATMFTDAKVYGLDIACVALNIVENVDDRIEYFDSEALNIPLDDNYLDVVASFDCLEHCLESDVPAIVKEFRRVLNDDGTVVTSIAYHQTAETSTRGEPLHMTVKSEEWWIEQFLKEFTSVEKTDGYLVFSDVVTYS